MRRSSIAFTVLAAAVLMSGAADAQGRRALRRVDADGDGKVTLQEFLAVRGAMFERLDLNHDGKITKDELAVFQSQMDKAAAGAEIRSGKERGKGEGPARQLSRLMEAASGGEITRAAWDAAMTKRFERLDTAHAGFIAMDQLRRRGGQAVAAPEGAAPMPPSEPR